MDDGSEGTGRRGTGGRLLLEGVLVAGIWLLFAGSLHWHDLLAAAALGVAATVGGAALRRRVGHRPATVAIWLPLLPSVAVGVLRDSWTVCLALVDLVRGRPVGGRIEQVAFHPGTPDGDGDSAAQATTRRVVATIATTLQPNSILVGFDREAGTAILHLLRPTDAPSIDRRLTEPR
ncbi:hypothetical protein [Egicoccus sp. AB-alg6-2]|uniref:hypothetical protein n=1 Tax=Egicoccus sp. AB-alg6-2 TaxID=3242692 RepID=UPI00359E89EF